MTSLTFNKTKLSTTYLSNISQVSQSTCSLGDVSSFSGNVIGVSNVTVKGDFTGLSNTFASDSTCVLATTQAETVQNLSLSQMNQTNDNDGTILNGLKYLGVQDNKFVSSTDYTNNMSQINQSTCNVSNVSSSNNNYIYVSNTSVGGNFVGFSNSSNASGSCGITNQSLATVYNQANQNGNQDNVQTGMFVAIAGIFAGIIGVVIFIVIVLFAVGALGYAGYSVTGKKKTAPGVTGAAALSPDDLELANELGISPDVLASELSSEPLPATLPAEPPPTVITTPPPDQASSPAAPAKPSSSWSDVAASALTSLQQSSSPAPAPAPAPTPGAKSSSSWSDVAASALTSLQKSSAYNNLQTPPAPPSSLSQTLNSLINSKPPA